MSTSTPGRKTSGSSPAAFGAAWSRSFSNPAPPDREVRIQRTLTYCPEAQSGVCPLGPVDAIEGEADDSLLSRVAASLADRGAALRECATQAGGGSAVLDVRLELTDGRIMAGQLNRRMPEDSPIARCGVGPLLGARVEGPAPEGTVQLRYIYQLTTRGGEVEVGSR